MKKIHSLLLILLLSVSLITPEFAVLQNAYNVYAEDTAAEEQARELTAYDKFRFTELDDQGSFKIPADMKDKIEISHTKYGDGVLLKGKVKDLNSIRIDLDREFNFDSGSAGRLSFDGLKDKDAGMSVDVLVYLDDADEAVSEFSLRKQMGKKEWANAGEKTVSMGAQDITGKHRVSLGFSINGKDESKKTSVSLRSIQFCKTTIPVMYFNIDESEGTIDAMNNSDDHSVECYGDVDLIVPDSFNNDDTFRDEYGRQESITGLQLEYIRGRGNSTWSADKKPYKVKFDKGQDLFGFGKNKHWTLLANRFDNSLVRNRMTYWLGQQLGMEYTPQCVPVEVVMNGEFYGSYLLCEQIRVGEGRVTIDDLDDVKDVPAVTDPLIETGGYLLSMEYDEDEVKSFTTENGMQLYIESPDENAEAYRDYIKAYTQKAENAIMGDDCKNEAGESYTDYLDLDSAVDYWWVQEFSENGDAYGSGSTYLYKKRDADSSSRGKLYWGPLWDFDYVAWGDLMYDEDPAETLESTSTPWFDAMKGDPEFINRVKTRWSQKGGLRDKLDYVTKEGGLLDKYEAQMKTSYDLDHEKWGAYESGITEYKGEIEQLRSWINARTAYVDSAVSKLDAGDHTVRFVVNGKTVKKLTVRGGGRLKDFPEAPAKKGYECIGWADENGTIYVEGDKPAGDLTLTPFYIEKSQASGPKKIFFAKNDVYYAPYIGSYGEDWYYNDYKVKPEQYFDPVIKWTSSDESIATVEEGSVQIKGLGDVTITATLPNGVSGSYRLHLISDSEFKDYEGFKLNKKTLTLREGEYAQLQALPLVTPCYDVDFAWVSDNEKVATVDELGIIDAKSPGTAEIMAIDMMTRSVKKCKVTVKRADVKYNGNTYRITSDKKGSRTAALVKAKNVKSVIIPATIKAGGRTYKVTRVNAEAFKGKKLRRVTLGSNIKKIRKNAFSGSKVTALTIRTKYLKKASVKGSLKGSKVKTVRVRISKKKAVNSKYLKRYKQYFTKANAGRKIKVK